MRPTVLLAALLAVPLSVIAEEDVIIWTTIVEWVGPGGTPIAAPGGNGQLANGADGKVEEHNNNPVPMPAAVAPVASVAPVVAAPAVNEKVAVHNNGGGQPAPQLQQQKHNVAPVVAPIAAPSPKVVSAVPVVTPSSGSSTGGSSSGGGGGGFAEGTCTGSGMNIFWTGDVVDYTYEQGGSGSGSTAGCLNLGNFAGSLFIGGTKGTLFEGNWGGGGTGQFFDISFIYGFSVPVVCKAGTAMTGCSIDLHSQGIPCPSSSDGKLCSNPTGPGGSNDPGAPVTSAAMMASEPWCHACSAPDPFFHACAGSGYTYPYDDHATVANGGTITCCVGTSCGMTGREGIGKNGNPQPAREPGPCALCGNNSKRGLEAVIEDSPAMTPSLLPRKHKRHQHQHRHADMHAVKRY